MPMMYEGSPSQRSSYYTRNVIAPITQQAWGSEPVPVGPVAEPLYDPLPSYQPLQPSPALYIPKPADYVSGAAVAQRPTSNVEAATGAPTGAPSASGGGYTGSYSGGLGPSAYGYSGTTGTKGTKGSAPYGFQAPMWSALQAANKAMAAAGLGHFGITDGWRSYDAQVSLKAKKGNLAATPGRSVHGLGYAADLRLSKAQLDWLYKNGSRYGLVNLPSESWHWQYDPRKVRQS